MIKWLISLCLIFSSWMVQGHQPDVSSTMLIEQPDGSWLLQVRASLTAFQYEVRNKYGEDSYDTPEKFQELVSQHLAEQLTVFFNQKDTAVLQNAYVKLGHETNVVFEVLGVPKIIKSLSVQNSSFQNIHRNQSALLVLKKGFPKEQYILNNSNQHTIELLVDGSQFVEYAGARFNKSPSVVFLLAGMIVLVFGTVLIYRKKNTAFSLQQSQLKKNN